MAKRKKNESTKDFQKRTSKVLDLTPDPMVCDVTASDGERTIEGMLKLERDYKTCDNMTVSWRVPGDVLKHAKKVAMEESLKKKDTIHYQKLVLGCFLDEFPMSEE